MGLWQTAPSPTAPWDGIAFRNVVALPYGWSVAGSLSVNSASTPPASLTRGTYWLPPGTYKVSANTTFPSGVVLNFAPGAILKPDSGVTITLDSVPGITDNSRIFDLSNGGGAKVVFTTIDRPVMADWWGAAETGLFVTEMQRAIDAVWNSGAGCGVVQLAGRAYSTSSNTTITGRAGVKVQGVQNSHHITDDLSSTIVHTGTSFLFTFTSAGSQSTSKFDISDLRIIGSSSGAGALSITSGQICQYERLHIRGYTASGAAGVYFASCVGVVLEKSRIQNCFYGVLADTNTTTTYIKNSRIEDCGPTAGVNVTAGGNPGAAVKLVECDGLVKLDGCAIESNNGRGVWIVGPTFQPVIEDCWFEGNNTPVTPHTGDVEDIYLDGTVTDTISAARIVGNRINSGAVTMNLRAEFLSDSVISENMFGNSTPTWHIRLEANCSDNLCFWNRLATGSKYSDVTTSNRNIRNERNQTNQLGTEAKCRGYIDLNAFGLKDTAAGGNPSVGFTGATPEAAIIEDPGSVRWSTSVGAEFVKISGTGNTGWRRVPVIGPGFSTLTANSTTPSVSTASGTGQVYKTANTNPTSITNFTNPVDGQIIYILALDGAVGAASNTTLVNGATLRTTTGANKNLTNGVVYKLIYDLTGTVWVEF